MNLEEEIAKQLSNKISKEIDFAILSEVLKSCGWERVELETLGSRKNSIDIITWCEQHVRGRYNHMGRVFVFENQGDAVNFVMKWVK